MRKSKARTLPLHKRWRVWALAGGLACFAIAFAAMPRLWPPGPMAYCKAMQTRGLVRDCINDPSPPAESRSVLFRVASSGKQGRVSNFSNKDAYWAEFRRWKAEEDSLDAYLLGYGKALIFVYVPGPLDSVERHDFEDFHITDMELVTQGRPLGWHGTHEHPVPSESCRRAPACAAEGRCAILPTRPDKCIAGFDKDCRASLKCTNPRQGELAHCWGASDLWGTCE